MFGPEAIRISNHFDSNCNWGNEDLTCADLVIILGEMSDEYEGKFIIDESPGAVYNPNFVNHEYESWHTPTEGRNLYAMAADIFPTGSLAEAFILCLKYFSSVGFYPDRTLEHDSKILKGAFHVDLRIKEYACDCNHIWWVQNGVYKPMTKKDILTALILMS